MRDAHLHSIRPFELQLASCHCSGVPFPDRACAALHPRRLPRSPLPRLAERTPLRQRPSQPIFNSRFRINRNAMCTNRKGFVPAKCSFQAASRLSIVNLNCSCKYSAMRFCIHSSYWLRGIIKRNIANLLQESPRRRFISTCGVVYRAELSYKIYREPLLG